MTLIDQIYLAVALAVGILSVRNPRGLLWLAAITASYFISGFYWRTGMTNAELVTGLCDAAVIVAMVFLARYRWELWLWAIQLGAVAVSFLFLAHNFARGTFISHETYSIALELLNALALITIGSASAHILAGKTDGRTFHPWVHIFGFVRPFNGTSDR